jgi:hypothetical protein
MAASSYLEPRTQRSVFRVRKRDAGCARVMRAWHSCATRDECRGDDNTCVAIGSEAGFRRRQVSAHHDIAEGLTSADIPVVISGRPGTGEPMDKESGHGRDGQESKPTPGPGARAGQQAQHEQACSLPGSPTAQESHGRAAWKCTSSGSSQPCGPLGALRPQQARQLCAALCQARGGA